MVNAVLAEMRGALRILPVSLPGLKTAPGLTAWAGESFQNELQHTIRIWPHLNDTGGFYIALLEKIGEAPREAVQTPEMANPDFQTAAGSTQQVWDDAPRMFDIIGKRFGIEPAAFTGLQLLLKSRRDIYGVAADHRPPQMTKCISGLPLFHMHFQYPKLTTSCAAAYGHLAARHTVDASPSQVQDYLARKPFTLKKDQAHTCDSTGYVLVRYQNAVLGVGFYDQKQGIVASLFPKSMATL